MVIVADEIADPEKGTGAVKITPAHSFEDYEVGVRHKLDVINILNDDGTINSNAGEKFAGMKRFHARKAVVDGLKQKGLWVETKDNGVMQLPTCAKSGDIIEPLVKPQWWVNCQDAAKEAIEVGSSDFVIWSALNPSRFSGHEQASSPSLPNLPSASGTSGSVVSETGASRGNCGGAIVVRHTSSRSRARSRMWVNLLLDLHESVTDAIAGG